MTARIRKFVPVKVNEPRSLFDERPIELQGFKFRARSVAVVGKPSAANWTAAAQFAAAVEESSPYWIGDLISYAESRTDWSDRVDQLVSITGLARQTIHNRTYIAKHVDEPERALAPTLSHAAVVAPLDRGLQTKLLSDAREEGWTVPQLRRAVRQAKRPKVLEGQAVLEGMHRVILAAPDWSRMSIAAIAGLPVQLHAAAESILFLYCPARFMLSTPGAREVLDGWGFTYQTHGVWDRVLDWADGAFLTVTHEDLIIATRGEIRPDAVDFRPRSVHTERRPTDMTHVKPEAIRRQWIEKLFVRGPFLELFGPGPVEGWSVFGSDPGSWAQEAEAESAVG